MKARMVINILAGDVRYLGYSLTIAFNLRVYFWGVFKDGAPKKKSHVDYDVFLNVNATLPRFIEHTDETSQCLLQGLIAAGVIFTLLRGSIAPPTPLLLALGAGPGRTFSN